MDCLVLSTFDEEESAGYFAVIVFWVSCYCKYYVALTHGAVSFSAIASVVFPDHTHLLMRYDTWSYQFLVLTFLSDCPNYCNVSSHEIMQCIATRKHSNQINAP